MHGDVAPIDALAPLVDGCYADPLVTVGAHRASPGEPAVRTEHFDVTFTGGGLLVTHAVPPWAVDDNLAGMLNNQLFGPGWLRGSDLFERVFTGVVRTSLEDALTAWELFYRNTTAALAGRARRDPGTIRDYGPVQDHALDLLAGDSALELGCRFGFLSLRVAGTGRATTASDMSPGTVRLLDAMAPLLGVRLGTVTADAARFPAGDGLADTVLAVHLLEHLDADHGAQVLAEAIRLAVRRVVVAVPLETEPDEAFGHVRTVSLDDLHRWGRASGRPFDVHELHGGWLVIDVG